MRGLQLGTETATVPSLPPNPSLRFASVSLCGALALSLAGCSEPGVPVATVSVALNRASVPLGGPMEVAFRFERFDSSPELNAIDGEYRVLVHFLDDEGSIMWTDDHDPPVPTSSWQSGQAVAYSRRVFVPLYPYIGEAVVAVGLYSPTTGERLTLLGEGLGERAYRGAVFTLTPQAVSSHLVYGDGWHGGESRPGISNPGSGDEWRWTSDRASVTFRNPHSDMRLYLNLAGRPGLFEDGEQRVGVRVGGTLTHEIPLMSGERQFQELDLRAEQLGDADMVRLDLEVDPSFVPSELPDLTSEDVRRLGVRVFYIFLETL